MASCPETSLPQQVQPLHLWIPGIEHGAVPSLLGTDPLSSALLPLRTATAKAMSTLPLPALSPLTEAAGLTLAFLALVLPAGCHPGLV